MYLLLIAIIYLAFISLGLPDSLLGSAWPVMRMQINAPLDYAGVVSLIITGSTVISTLFSGKLIWKYKTGLITAVSTLLSAISLFGFSTANSFAALCIWAVPYGLGAGAIDAGLNNYVALHYNSKHMSWLHCFWGIGATIGPMIMAQFIAHNSNWQGGYRCVSLIQIVIALVLFLTLPLWKKNEEKTEEKTEKQPTPLKETLKIDGILLAILAFIGYCSCETTAGLWASSYLVEARGVDQTVAAKFASLFYLGITFGRFIMGFFADMLGDRKLIKMGSSIMIVGIICMMLPISGNALSLAGLLIIGLGCAPIFPSIIHSTPENFGKENTSNVISVEMTSAYIGCSIMPALFGMLARRISINLYPVYMLASTLLFVGAINYLYIKRKKQSIAV